MAKVTIEIEDTGEIGGEVRVNVEFDPVLGAGDSEFCTPARDVATKLINVLVGIMEGDE